MEASIRLFSSDLLVFSQELPTAGWDITGDLGIGPRKGMIWGGKRSLQVIMP